MIFQLILNPPKSKVCPSLHNSPLFRRWPLHLMKILSQLAIFSYLGRERSRKDPNRENKVDEAPIRCCNGGQMDKFFFAKWGRFPSNLWNLANIILACGCFSIFQIVDKDDALPWYLLCLLRSTFKTNSVPNNFLQRYNFSKHTLLIFITALKNVSNGKCVSNAVGFIWQIIYL